MKLGTKYHYFIGDELNVVRIVNIKNEDSFVLMDTNGDKFHMNSQEIKDKLVKLEPDAVLNLMTTVDENHQGVNDVYACVNKDPSKPLPDLILRQNTYSVLKNSIQLQFGQVMYVGDCFCNKNYPSEAGLKEMFEFTDILNTLSVSLYLDDTLDDIFKVIGKRDKKFNNVLCKIKAEADEMSSGLVQGYCTTLRQLFEENAFMFNYRLIFNIAQIDFTVELEDGLNINKDGDIFFNNKQKKLFEDYLRKYICDVKILKYDKDIDISKIVNSTHMVVSDKSDQIYIITYVVEGDYPVDEDIKNAMS